MAINTKNRNDLKSYFVKNAIPTEGNFADLIDAPLNQADDGVFKLAGEPLSVVAADGQQKRTLRLYASYPSANPDWLISLNPAQNPGDPATNRPGFGIADGAANTRLFIDAATGNLGVGTNAPPDKLTVHGGDLRVEGGRFRRLRVVSDQYWAGIELVVREQGEAGSPYLDFRHGEPDGPNHCVRVFSPTNDTLKIQKTDLKWAAHFDTEAGNVEVRKALRIGNWALVANGNKLYVQLGDSVVARFSVGWDRFLVFQNIDGRGPYFYYNTEGDFGHEVTPQTPP